MGGSSSDPDESHPVTTFFGRAFVGVGLLIACLSGLCTAATLVQALARVGVSGGRGDYSTLGVLVLVFGGVPIGVGTGLALFGRWLLRRRT